MQPELKQISNLALFAKVVQIGGISRCAATLGMERTTVSRRIGELESALGVKLLSRSPRAVSVTEAGRLCFNECEQILEIAKAAETVATNGRRVINAAPLLLGSPPDILEHFVSSIVASFEEQNPSSNVECRPVFRPAENLEEDLDYLISWDQLDATEYLVSNIGSFDQAIYASLDYLSRRGVPKSPDDLHLHTRISVSGLNRTSFWVFERDGYKQRICGQPEIVVSNMLEGVSSTMAGLGLCLFPKYLGERHVKSGKLVTVLPDYDLPAKSLYLVAPRQAPDKPRATTFRIFLERRLPEKTSSPTNESVNRSQAD